MSYLVEILSNAYLIDTFVKSKITFNEIIKYFKTFVTCVENMCIEYRIVVTIIYHMILRWEKFWKTSQTQDPYLCCNYFRNIYKPLHLFASISGNKSAIKDACVCLAYICRSGIRYWRYEFIRKWKNYFSVTFSVTFYNKNFS